jgi:two-component system, LytTR family, response regulator
MQQKLQVYHVDETEQELNKLAKTISTHKHFELIGSSTNAKTALDEIIELKPSIVFAETSMKLQDGFWLAAQLKPLKICVVFLTDSKNDAVKAFEISALQYVSKPCLKKDLDRVYIDFKKLSKSPESKLENYKLTVNDEKANLLNKIPKRIIINNIEKTSIIPISELTYAKSKGSYTNFKLTDGSDILSSKNIKVYSDLLDNHPDIVRIHRAVLVNKNCVKAIRRDKHLAFVQLKNGEEVEISIYRKEEVIQELMY